MLATYLLFYGSAFAFSVFLSVCIILLATSKVYPIVHRSKKEKYFFDPNTKKFVDFPKSFAAPVLNLSVIVPAYNEEERLPLMLDECTDFLEARCKKISSFKYEIIIVSDGSRDKTVEVSEKYCLKLGTDKIRVLDLETNRGKGGAVRLGMQSARGALLLLADADGASKFSDLVKLETAIQKITNYDYLENIEDISRVQAIAIGSRSHLEEQAIASRSLFRTFLMYGFHFLVWMFAVRGIKDTQCGFKLLTQNAADICFGSLHVERWAFDVELLYIAQKLKIPIEEVAVQWTEMDGSKLTPFWSWVQMGRDLVLIWLRYTIGAWKIKPKTN